MKATGLRIPHTLVLLFAMMVVAWLLTLVLPQGGFETIANEQGREVVLPGTYTEHAERTWLAPWTLLTVIPHALADAQGIIFFVFIIGGVLAVVRSTGAFDALIGRILERVGAHHVVYPEHDMGHQVAHLMGGRMIDWFQLDETFVMVETEVPTSMIGKTLTEIGIRANHDVTVVCVKPVGGSFTYATADTVIKEGDLLLVAGENRQAQRFADLT